MLQWLRLHLPMQGVQVQSLIRKLRSPVPHSQNIKQKQCYNKVNKDFKNGQHQKERKKLPVASCEAYNRTQAPYVADDPNPVASHRSVLMHRLPSCSPSMTLSLRTCCSLCLECCSLNPACWLLVLSFSSQLSPLQSGFPWLPVQSQ